jgi:S1-C subfamily serine protease
LIGLVSAAVPAAFLLAFGALAPTTSAAPAPAASTIDRTALLDAVRPSFVIVDIRLKQDRGDMPDGFLMGRGGFEGYFGGFVEEERPIELPGFLLDRTTVVVRDPEIPARFIQSISVRQGDARVDASPKAWLTDDGGVLLELAAPLPAPATPLRFAAAAPDPKTPLATVSASDWQGVWALIVGPAEERKAMELTSKGPVAVEASEPDGVVVDPTGAVVRMNVTGRRGSGGASPSPATWPQRTNDELVAELAAAAKALEASVLRTTLHFRSPRKTTSRGMFGMDTASVGTELETLSIVLDDGSLLVLADLAASVTARLERVEVVDASGTSHDAAFTASLRDWGAFLARPSASLGSGIALSDVDLATLRNVLLAGSSIRVVGRNRVSDPMHLRFGMFETGWRGIRFPVAIPEAQTAFVLGSDRSLVAFPIAKRSQPGEESRFGRRSSGAARATPASVLASTLRSLDAAKDPTNIPLTEEEESRTGWLGVMMQPLEPELARANNVAEITRDGEFGGLVTFVYPGSPAEKAGIQPGDVLVSITTPRRDRPIEIGFGDGDLGFMGVFPWERLDELPEEYYDQIPAPWPPIEDTLNRTLTELGIGSSYTLQFARDGATKTLELAVEQSPPHFNNAPKFEAKAMGLTARDLTLEVRQYLNLAADAPGVIVSKLEPGQRASVAGMRPFEIITHVDDQPVASAAEFGAAIEGKSDLKFTVKRAQRERVVKVSIPAGG